MKVAILIVALACVTSVWGAAAPGLSQPTCPTTPTYASCSVSGDPHWTMFDGPGHDFQGAGLYQQVIGDFISVQTIHEACNAPHKVTCIRRAYVQITDPDDSNNWVKYTWGTWPGVAMENVTVIQPGKANIAMLPSKLPSSGLLIMNGALKMTWASNRVNIAWARTTGTKFGPKIAIGEYYLVVSLPKDFHPTGVFQTCGNPWINTYGLCGYFNNLAGDDFSAQNGTVYVAGAVSGTRYNSPAKAVNQWGSTYAVDGVRHQRIFQGQPGFHMLDATNFDIPSDEQSAEAQKTTFADLATLQAADAACKEVSPDTQTYENCMYDAARSPNFDLALSNGAAAAAAAEITTTDDSSSGLSTEAQVGIAVGVAGGVALIAIAVAIVYYKKYNVSEYERSKLALVVYDSQHPNNQKAGAAAESSVMDQL